MWRKSPFCVWHGPTGLYVVYTACRSTITGLDRQRLNGYVAEKRLVAVGLRHPVCATGCRWPVRDLPLWRRRSASGPPVCSAACESHQIVNSVLAAWPPLNSYSHHYSVGLRLPYTTTTRGGWYLAWLTERTWCQQERYLLSVWVKCQSVLYAFSPRIVAEYLDVKLLLEALCILWISYFITLLFPLLWELCV